MKTIKRDTLMFYLKNSSEEIQLGDLLTWLSQYTSTTIEAHKSSENIQLV
jgi:hypothetical protein